MYLLSLAESAKLEEAEEEGDEDLEPWQGDDGEWDKEIDDDDEGDDEADTQKLAKLAAQVHILTKHQYWNSPGYCDYGDFFTLVCIFHSLRSFPPCMRFNILIFCCFNAG